MAESELALSESKVNELSALLDKAREQAADNAKLHQNELKREREVTWDSLVLDPYEIE